MFFTTESDIFEIMLFIAAVTFCLLVMARTAHPTDAIHRLLFSFIAFTSLATYLAWRAADTLPPLEMAATSLWPYVYFTFETISIIYALGSILILLRVRDNSDAADEAEAALTESGDYPLVDVFICTYNEPLNILEKSIVPAKHMDYPNFRVFVCDDTRRAEVREYCDRVGVSYITRPDNAHAKAGNLNNALATTNRLDVRSDLIMVLDADFAPQRNFLRRVVGLFSDPTVGVVQTPQFYFNSDPIQHNLGLSSSFVDDQRVFFDTFQPAKDAVDCAFCVGTSFVVRRRYVNELGGFPHDALSEDMLLSYRLMEKGYVTRWLNEKLSVGLSAEGVPEYITQRTRWCLGTIQIGLLKNGPLGTGRFTLLQRLHYLHGLLNWMSKPFILCLLFAPTIYWALGMPALQADELLFLKYGLSSLMVFWIYSSWISRKRTLPLFTEVTHALTALPVVITLAQAIRRPFGRPFKVTEKGGDRSEIRIHRPTALFFLCVSILSAIGIVQALYGPDAPTELSPQDALNVIWSCVSMIIASVCLLVCIELPRHGQEELLQTRLDAVACFSNGRRAPVEVVAMSTEAARLASHIHLDELPEALHFPLFGRIPVSNLSRGNLQLAPEFDQKIAIIRTLFATAPNAVADTGSFFSSVQNLMRRALWA